MPPSTTGRLSKMRRSVSKKLKKQKTMKQKIKSNFIHCNGTSDLFEIKDSVKTNTRAYDNYTVDAICHSSFPNIFNEIEQSQSSYEDFFRDVENSKKFKLKKCRIFQPDFTISPLEVENEFNQNEGQLKINNDGEENDYSYESDSEVHFTQPMEMDAPTKSQKKVNENSVQYYMTSCCCIFVMKHPSKLYFHGKLLFSVVSGAVEIFGHTFNQNCPEMEVYSPRSTGFFCFETVATKRNKNLTSKLKKLNLDEDTIKSIDGSTENICVIVLKKLENRLIKTLDNYSMQMFPKIFKTNEGRFFSPVELKLQSYFEEDESESEVLNKSKYWTSDVIDKIESKTRLFVCGGKGTGKSTFLRYAVNKLLNSFKKVVYIDLDPGQPEFGVPGTISVTVVEKPLLGPNYTHSEKPNKCCFIGEVNITHCFERYLNSIKELMIYCSLHVDESIPWVVNYMGYTKSLGIDLVLSVIRSVKPTMIVQIQSNNNKINFPYLLHPEHVGEIEYSLKVIQSKVGEKQLQSEAKTLRETCIVSYFGKMSEQRKNLNIYSISLPSIKLSHISGVNENLLSILNGNLVALCTDHANNCQGFGIVQGIDLVTDTLYLTTPESKDLIRKVNNLVMGSITLPICFYLQPECKQFTPYVNVKIKEKTTNIPKRSYMPCQKLLRCKK